MNINQVGVTGVSGRVASRLIEAGARPLSFDVRNSKAISIPDGIELVINCAAVANVDECEVDQLNASAVNTYGVHNLINACYPKRVKLLQISSDHVFDGKRWFGSYKEGDKFNPLNHYGRTKMVSENLIRSYEYGKVVRTSYLAQIGLFGAGNVFSTKIKRTFMVIEDFVDCLIYYVENWYKMPQMLHISGTKKYNWYQAAYLYHAYMNFDVSMLVAKNRWDTVGYTDRPKNGGLDVSLAKKLGVPVRSFEEGMKARWAHQS